MKLWGWLLFHIGGIGAIIAAGVGNDWPMYAFIILGSLGVILIMYSAQRTRKKISADSHK